MGINLACRRRKRFALGLLAAGFAGVTALGGAMAASADELKPGEEEYFIRGDFRASDADAKADRPDLEAECRDTGGTPTGFGIGGIVEDGKSLRQGFVICFKADPNPNRDRDFFSPV